MKKTKSILSLPLFALEPWPSSVVGFDYVGSNDVIITPLAFLWWWRVLEWVWSGRILPSVKGAGVWWTFGQQTQSQFLEKWKTQQQDINQTSIPSLPISCMHAVQVSRYKVLKSLTVTIITVVSDDWYPFPHSSPHMLCEEVRSVKVTPSSNGLDQSQGTGTLTGT